MRLQKRDKATVGDVFRFEIHPREFEDRTVVEISPTTVKYSVLDLYKGEQGMRTFCATGMWVPTEGYIPTTPGEIEVNDVFLVKDELVRVCAIEGCNDASAQCLAENPHRGCITSCSFTRSETAIRVDGREEARFLGNTRVPMLVSKKRKVGSEMLPSDVNPSFPFGTLFYREGKLGYTPCNPKTLGVSDGKHI